MSDNGGFMQTPPDDPKELSAWLLSEMREVVFQLENIQISFFTVSYAEPAKPRETMIRFADGTEWDPGSGRGLYQYVSGSWTPLF